MIELEELKPYQKRYENNNYYVPFILTAELVPGSQVTIYDPINLDNLLARAVLEEATQGRGVPDSDEPYMLPVPLVKLWESSQGLPLWASTVFFPVGQCEADVFYWHKRAMTGNWTKTKTGKFAVKIGAGRFMERRVPVPTKVCDAWQAFGIGDPMEIIRLVGLLANIGKKRAIGFGEVGKWRVDIPEAPTEILVIDGLLTRPVPEVAAAELGLQFDEPPRLIGWTPPQWKPSLFEPGWPVGVKCMKEG